MGFNFPIRDFLLTIKKHVCISQHDGEGDKQKRSWLIKCGENFHSVLHHLQQGGQVERQFMTPFLLSSHPVPHKLKG